MIPFLYANELKKHYIAYGSFYNIIQGNDLTPCRNLLDIYDKVYFKTNVFKNLANGSLTQKLSNFQPNFPQHQDKPDAVFIMMNPGSSKPLQLGYIVPTFKMNGHLPKKISSNPLIIAKPDITQYQIMRIMSYKKWHHVRIINLSDIRESKSSLFFKKVTAFTPNIHTIFSQERTAELYAVLVANNTPVFAAWGQDKELIDLATQCLRSIPQTLQPKGVKYNKGSLLFAHPSPFLKEHKLEWLKQIQKLLPK